MARIDPEHVRQIAHLAKIGLAEGDLEKYAAQLGDIIEYVEKLNELDLEGVEPFTHAVELNSVFREDEIRPSVDRLDAVQNAPGNDGTFFIVPPVIG